MQHNLPMMYPDLVDTRWMFQDLAPPLQPPPPPPSPPSPPQHHHHQPHNQHHQQQQQQHHQQQHSAATASVQSPLLLLSPTHPAGSDPCPEWRALHPARWDQGHVFEWVSWHVESSRADAGRIPAEAFEIDGPALLAMGRRQVQEAVGCEALGARMHAHLAEMLSRAGDDTHLRQHGGGGGGGGGGAGQREMSVRAGDVAAVAAGAAERHRATTPQPDSPRGAEVKQEPEDIGCTQRKHKHGGSRGALLWEFLRDLLLGQAEGGSPGLLRWEDRQAGSFRFVRAGDVARLWGERKRNPGMTYEKLSRAMRYYYKRGILERVDGRRLVYRFGSKSSGWRSDS